MNIYWLLILILTRISILNSINNTTNTTANTSSINYEESIWQPSPLYKKLIRAIVSKEDISKLITKENVDESKRKSEGETPLDIAIMDKNFEAIDKLLEKAKEYNIDIVNTPDIDHRRPLQYAVGLNNLDVIKSLLKNKANPVLPNKEGQTPLDYAEKLYGKEIDILPIAKARGF